MKSLLHDQGDALAFLIVRECTRRRIKISTAESFTGGLLINKLTNISGSGAVTRGGVIWYWDHTKELNGVWSEIIRQHTVYSKAVAIAMAQALLVKTDLTPDLTIGTTGCTNTPDPYVLSSRPGQCWIAVAGDNLLGGKVTCQEFNFPISQDREEMKLRGVIEAFKMVLDYLGVDRHLYEVELIGIPLGGNGWNL